MRSNPAGERAGVVDSFSRRSKIVTGPFPSLPATLRSQEAEFGAAIHRGVL
jgi:hypothetical protein